MQYGCFFAATDVSLDPATVARMVEAGGFESIWLPEHTHIPVAAASSYPAAAEMPAHFARLLDPVVALTAAAAATERLLLGFGICLVAEHDPIVLAKQIASLDLLSGGRVLVGVGAGWNREEMRNHGVDPRQRMRVMVERVQAMRELWTEEVASFDGADVSFERVWSWPKPLQEPHPPLLVGGTGATVLERVEALDGEWFPSLSGDEAGVLERVIRFRAERARAGRPARVSLNAARPDRDALRSYAEAGVDRCVFDLPSTGDAGLLEARLGELAELVVDSP